MVYFVIKILHYLFFAGIYLDYCDGICNPDGG